MNVDPQEYLDLVEHAGKLVFVDSEALNLRGDYGALICVSFKPYGRRAYTLAIENTGRGIDRRLVRAAKAELEKYSAWCTYYGRGFDLPMLNTRLLRWGINPVEKRLHLDLYWTLKANTLVSRRSQGHLLAWLKTPEQKLSVSASTWAEFDVKRDLHQMIRRCESDAEGLEALYKRTRHLVRELKR